METLKKLVLHNFPQAELKEEHMNQLMYQLPLKDTWLPQVFHVMEKAKADSNGDLEDYSVSQLTLDDVFIQFASKQSENDDTNTKEDDDLSDKEVISMETLKETLKNADTLSKTIDPEKKKDLTGTSHEKQPHEFANPMVFSERPGSSETPVDRRREFFSSMIAAAEASEQANSASSAEEGGVELINVSSQRRSTIENIVDSVALEV